MPILNTIWEKEDDVLVSREPEKPQDEMKMLKAILENIQNNLKMKEEKLPYLANEIESKIKAKEEKVESKPVGEKKESETEEKIQ